MTAGQACTRAKLLDLLASTGFHTRLLAGNGSVARFR
jgi:hypothetical protein